MEVVKIGTYADFMAAAGRITCVESQEKFMNGEVHKTPIRGSLPMFPEITPEQHEYVAESIALALEAVR